MSSLRQNCKTTNDTHWEQEDVKELLQKLEDTRLIHGLVDGWIWNHDKGGHYVARNAYKVLQNEVVNGDFGFFKSLWACNVPLKMGCLVWRMSLYGIPTKLNLVRQGVLGAQDLPRCALCGVMDESTNHLFFSCSIS
ncbi:hypothetical protein Lal_00035196 [Lupinus albus]|nr:hypothetical protein Lal_00035196 [Lupinus albus]